MKKLTILFISIWVILNVTDVFAVPPQKKIFKNTIVKTGTSTKDIMPLLVDIYLADMQGKFFERIYGQYRGNYILIKMDSNGKIDEVDEMERIADNVIKMVMSYHPSSKGRLELNASEIDIWASIVLQFESGQLINKKITSTKEEINKTIQQRKQGHGVKFGLSEDERKQFYIEYCEIPEKASIEAEAKYPPPFLSLKESWKERQKNPQVQKFLEFKDILTDKYDKVLLKKYSITKEQAEEISKEGWKKYW